MLSMLRKMTLAECLTGFSLLLRLGSGVILLPLMLKYVETSELGIWYIFISVGAIGPLFDLGFSATLTRFAAIFWAGGESTSGVGLPSAGSSGPNLSKLGELYAAARIIYLILTVIICVTLLFVAPHLAFSAEVGRKIVIGSPYLWPIFAAFSGLLLYSQFTNSILRGIGMTTQAQISQITATLVNLATVGTLLMMKFGLWAMVAGTGTNVMILGLSSRAFLRNAGVTPRRLSDLSMLRDMYPSTWRMAIVGLGSYATTHLTTLFFGKYLSLEETASYGLTNQVIGLVMSFAGIKMYVASPNFTALLVRGRRDIMAAEFRRILAAGCLLYVVCFVGLLVLGNPALALMGSKTQLLPAGLFCLFGAIRFLEFHHGLYANIVMATNRVPFVMTTAISIVIIYVIGVFAGPHLGAFGLISTVGVAQLLTNNWYPVYLGRKILNN